MSAGYYICFALTLVILNGIFVAAEISIVKIRNTQIDLLQQKHTISTPFIKSILSEQEIYLSTCQFGVTLTSLALGWIGEPAFSSFLVPLFKYLHIYGENMVSILSVTIVFTIISIMHIVIGELVPKSIALRTTEKVLILTAVPLYIFHKIVYPIIYLLNKLSMSLMTFIGYEMQSKPKNNYTKEEIRLIINSETEGKSSNILNNSLDFFNLIAADIMHSDTDLQFINSNVTINEVKSIISSKKFSRYPIFDHISYSFTGIVHVKDILDFIFAKEGYEDVLVSQLSRPILSFRYDTSISDVFVKFSEGHSHLAIIKNSFGEVIGFITIDSIIGTLLGNINDEFNQQRSYCISLKNGNYLVRGSTTTYMLEKITNIRIGDSLAKTVNGMILNKLSRIPIIGESIKFSNFTIIIKKMREHEVLLAKIVKLPDGS